MYYRSVLTPLCADFISFFFCASFFEELDLLGDGESDGPRFFCGQIQLSDRLINGQNSAFDMAPNYGQNSAFDMAPNYGQISPLFVRFFTR